MNEIKLPLLPHLPLNDPAAAYKAVHDYGKQCATTAIEADQQARGEPIYMVQHCSENNRWQITTKERFSYLKEYENSGDWAFMIVTI